MFPLNIEPVAIAEFALVATYGRATTIPCEFTGIVSSCQTH
jgi:hypothetical protein